jgi:hypothetical protein
VALAVYDAGGPSLRLPLDPGHPLIAALRAALAAGGAAPAAGAPKAGPAAAAAAAAAAGRELAAALLEAALAAREAPAGVERLAPLLALHALVAAEPALCVPEDDPPRFVRSLAPYLKQGTGACRALWGWLLLPLCWGRF